MKPALRTSGRCSAAEREPLLRPAEEVRRDRGTPAPVRRHQRHGRDRPGSSQPVSTTLEPGPDHPARRFTHRTLGPRRGVSASLGRRFNDREARLQEPHREAEVPPRRVRTSESAQNLTASAAPGSCEKPSIGDPNDWQTRWSAYATFLYIAFSNSIDRLTRNSEKKGTMVTVATLFGLAAPSAKRGPITPAAVASI